ncbi:hypothetical protein ANOM_009262 [Aspergillus nomiae NRRL 13137]|uniref:AMP-dependent synthetase/ligase domain-containing protein n=1 Tax=Aspergillus nomiae NRRL (strain ATCC 15546 / NRRL 13137 / CBS 260.88 / M93) TaxID=1509407 RepID=A0A0L1ISP9_ASPN3|nr:uncharacterized protein ANOM_009262 [Aspergillus nomiae NRRL 13137]KNG82420.1 hypothetical protein ANOM_009262 [Aspergillus nomiae NRRL 13137]
MGIGRDDRVAIFPGDDERFAELVIAVTRIGAVLVVLNKTFTFVECDRAIRHTEASLLFIGDMVNFKSTRPLIQHIQAHPVPGLKQTVLIRTNYVDTIELVTWDDILRLGNSVSLQDLHQAQHSVHCHDIAYVQFTSGTAGVPKAAMLSHYGGRFDTLWMYRAAWRSNYVRGYITAATDPDREKLETGSRGELCISGYLLQKGYYKNEEKTAEALCRITGRIKDIIIRGGENIYPTEIEERLMEPPDIEQAAIVGLEDDKYGEIVAAFSSITPTA